jgi:hypothetical protein
MLNQDSQTTNSSPANSRSSSMLKMIDKSRKPVQRWKSRDKNSLDSH